MTQPDRVERPAGTPPARSHSAWTDELSQNLRYALRTMRRTRGVTAVAMGTLAIGIALVTVFFSILNAAALRPAPYADATRIFALSEVNPRVFGFSRVSNPVLEQLQHSARSFERVAVYDDQSGGTLSDPGESISLLLTRVDTGLFALLGARPQVGRTFTPDEIRTGEHVVIISDSIWRTRFQQRHDLQGVMARINGQAYTVVGVMPPGFRFSQRTDLWVPLQPQPDTGAQLARPYSVLGKLRRGASGAQARQELQTIAQRLKRSDSAGFAGWTLVMRDDMVDRRFGGFVPASEMLIAAGLCVLLVACSNVANLLLARAVERRAEMAMRASLGASRGRLLRQNLTESLLLAVGAGAMGSLLAYWGIRILVSLIQNPGWPSWFHIGIDWRVLAFAFGLSLLTVLAFGLLPALEGTRVDLVAALKAAGDHAIAGGRATRRGAVVVVAELAFSVVLFVAASLVARTYQALSSAEQGYDAARVLEVYANLNEARYPTSEARTAFARDVGARLLGNPSVDGVAFQGYFTSLVIDSARIRAAAEQQKAARPGRETTRFVRPDLDLYLPSEPQRSVSADLHQSVTIYSVPDEYFRVIGLPIVGGRALSSSDGFGTAPVAVVTKALAQAIWKNRSPIGEQVRIGKVGTPVTIVGIAGDMYEMNGNATHSVFGVAPSLRVFMSERQASTSFGNLLIRARGNPVQLEPAITAAARGVDLDQVVFSMSLSRSWETNLWLARLTGGVFGILALCAIGLAMIGIYGVISYRVNQRTREIGIRVALGATSGGIVQLVMRYGLKLTAAGLLVGLMLAALLTRFVSILFWGVSAVDPVTYSAVTLIFAATAMAACYLPARRAAGVDPMAALRTD